MTDKQTNRRTDRLLTVKKRDGQTDKQTEKQTDRLLIGKKRDRQTDKQMDKQTDRATDRQTDFLLIL